MDNSVKELHNNRGLVRCSLIGELSRFDRVLWFLLGCASRISRTFLYPAPDGFVAAFGKWVAQKHGKDGEIIPLPSPRSDDILHGAPSRQGRRGPVRRRRQANPLPRLPEGRTGTFRVNLFPPPLPIHIFGVSADPHGRKVGGNPEHSEGL